MQDYILVTKYKRVCHRRDILVINIEIHFQIFNDHTKKHLTAERQKLNEKFQQFREWFQLIDEPVDSLSFDAFSWYGIQFLTAIFCR